MSKSTDDPEKELFEREILSREIEFLQAFTPDVFCCADRIGYVQAWKYGNSFCLKCKGVCGEYFVRKFYGCDMVSTCERYFSALCAGYPLWEV